MTKTLCMGLHGNSRKNDKEHHLYAIHDKEEVLIRGIIGKAKARQIAL